MSSDFPDYEAAMHEYINIVIARTGYGPYAQELADVTVQGQRVSVLSDFQTAQRIVNAALGDELLYRECSECKGWGRLKQGDPEPCPVCGGKEQVWPKENR